jgi:transcriptional regulator with XRE-family HTH domain
MATKSKFEMAIIEKAKAMREERRLTQDNIAAMLKISRGFVGQVESPNSASKYSLNQLNRLALEFGCSPKDFIPEKAVVESGKGKK